MHLIWTKMIFRPESIKYIQQSVEKAVPGRASKQSLKLSRQGYNPPGTKAKHSCSAHKKVEQNTNVIIPLTHHLTFSIPVRKATLCNFTLQLCFWTFKTTLRNKPNSCCWTPFGVRSYCHKIHPKAGGPKSAGATTLIPWFVCIPQLFLLVQMTNPSNSCWDAWLMAASSSGAV